MPFAGDFCWYFCTGIHTCTHTHTWICFYSIQTSHLENNPLIIVPYVNQDTDSAHTYMYMCFAEEVIRNLESTLLQWCIQKDCNIARTNKKTPKKSISSERKEKWIFIPWHFATTLVLDLVQHQGVLDMRVHPVVQFSGG